jgi:hypothetical protein
MIIRIKYIFTSNDINVILMDEFHSEINKIADGKFLYDADGKDIKSY